MQKIEFTEQEATILLQCIDLVVKQQWLSFASTWLILSNKIQEALNKKEDKKETK